jgi:hypothetical protein
VFFSSLTIHRDGTPVREGTVSPTVPDRRPVGVLFREGFMRVGGFLFFFFILKTPCLLQIAHGEIHCIIALSFLSR